MKKILFLSSFLLLVSCKTGYFISSIEDSQQKFDESYTYTDKSIEAEILPYRAELESSMNEVIVVAAPYTSIVGSPGASRSASGIAAVVSIAKVLTGSEHQRTIQFVAYASEAFDPARNDLTGALRASEDFTVVAVLNLDSLAFPIREGGVWEVEVPMIVHSNDDALGTSIVNKFARTTGLRLTLAPGASKVGADPRSFLPTFTFVADVADSPAGSAADVAEAYDFSRLTQTVQKFQRLVERLANPDGV